MPGWEYCALEGLTEPFDVRTDVARLVRFTPAGPEILRAKLRYADVAQIMAALGAEGWEIAGCGSTRADQHTVYFKRPKL